MKAVWEQGSIPEQMKWEIIILLPKGGDDYRHGVGPKLLALQKHFWETATLVCRAGVIMGSRVAL